MIGEKVQAALNAQIVAEFYSAYLYLSMAAYFESVNLPGFAKWMVAQAHEESTHATKLYNYVNEQKGRVILKSIEAPPTQWDSPLAVFESTLAHEQKVTGLINNLVSLARQEKETDTESFLQWYVDEQVEEEESAGEVVDKLKSIQDDSQALQVLDQQMGQREFK